MHTIELTYTGNLRTQSIHLASQNQVITDAPIDNHGLGQAFSPTDLLCTSLAACMTTIMGITANTHHIRIDGMKASITKKMAAAPRKVAGVKIVFSNFPEPLSDKQKMLLEHAAKSCPVALSLHAELHQDVAFIW
ncbi:MAG: OsmC family protein [Flavobacteriales bacterium]